jgi:hypothetical protein
MRDLFGGFAGSGFDLISWSLAARRCSISVASTCNLCASVSYAISLANTRIRSSCSGVIFWAVLSGYAFPLKPEPSVFRPGPFCASSIPRSSRSLSNSAAKRLTSSGCRSWQIRSVSSRIRFSSSSCCICQSQFSAQNTAIPRGRLPGFLLICSWKLESYIDPGGQYDFVRGT